MPLLAVRGWSLPSEYLRAFSTAAAWVDDERADLEAALAEAGRAHPNAPVTVVPG